MKVFRGNFSPDDFKRPVLTLGSYDGLHLGHQEIIRRVLEEARKRGGEGVVFTFEPHPAKVLHPSDPFPLITPYGKKMKLLEEMGVQAVINYPFTLELASFSPERFVKEVLLERVNPEKVIVGYNFTFGSKKGGTAANLERMGRELGFEVEVVPPFKVGHQVVSSSRIRELIQRGAIPEANRLLGREFLIVGEVVPGKGRGRDLGFPTANIQTDQELLPPRGVYAAWAHLDRDRQAAVVNIGTRPTFGEGEFTIEAYLPGYGGDLYGRELMLGLVQRLREERPFEGPGELSRQIAEDVKRALEILQGKGGR
ncbi:MAG: riboflavin biosynthesis protein RibF [Deltaproteobacteria bacterium]|nr:MAG: riboflavin biosynthesis protein RibF [Deltaproteobacteria bacterium]